MKWRPSGPNARIFLLTEFPWSLLVAWQTSYLSLYMVARGTSPQAIGVALGVAAVLQVMGFLAVGGWTDRFGRKAVIQAGDAIGWVIPLGLFVFWPVPWVLLAGLVAENATAFVMAPWNSLFTEDADPKTVEEAYLVLQLLSIFGGLVIPLMAPWVARAGVLRTGATALAIGWPLVALSWGSRLFWLEESRAGRAQRARHQARRHRPWRDRLREGITGPNRRWSALRVLVFVPMTLFGTFAPLVLVAPAAEHLPPADLATLPLAGSAAGLLLWATRRRWQAWQPLRLLRAAALLMVAGLGLLAAAPPRLLGPVAVGWGLTALGQSLFWAVHTPLWVSGLSDEARVAVQGWAGAVAAVGIAALGPVLGSMVGTAPRLVMGILAVLAALTAPWLLSPLPTAATSDQRG